MHIYFSQLQFNLSKTATLKKTKMVFKTNYRLMQVQGEHPVILLTFVSLPFVITIFVLSIFEWHLKTDFTVFLLYKKLEQTERPHKVTVFYEGNAENFASTIILVYCIQTLMLASCERSVFKEVRA